jgi:histidinol-phosphate phosphatase family protein
MTKPEQAVVFCGGLGTRLRPLTNSLPKPMAPVNGKPFLEHLLQQIAEQGCSRFLLLTGYLGEIIRDYFGDGSSWGWIIEYSHGPVEWETGRRLWEVREQLDAQFLLLYSDNFVQFRLPRLMALHHREQVPLTLLLAPKTNGNIRVSSAGRIEAYVKTRIGNNLNYVEVGYMVVERDPVLALLSGLPTFLNLSFSAVLQSLAASQKLGGLVVCDPYHSISDPERLALMGKYLKVKKILLLDRDGTINEKVGKGNYITSWDQFRWVPKTREALVSLAEDGFKFIVITNQAGIARKIVKPEALEDIHQRMTMELAEDGVEVLKTFMSPHHWDENSFMRKPAPGMFFQAAKEFNLRMDRILYVGDDERDCMAAWNAGCGMVYLTEEVEMPSFENYPQPFLRTATLLDKVEEIKRTYSLWEQHI